MEKKITVYGTGKSAEMFVDEMPSNYKIISFLESNPEKKSFKGLPVKKFPAEEIFECDFIVIASMFYPEILDNLIKANFPISKIKIATSHKDDPRYGVLMIDPQDVAKDIHKYKVFNEEIAKIEELVSTFEPKLFVDRLEHLKYCFSQAIVSGNILEFGVYRGESLLYLSSLTENPVWGFDSFQGGLEDSPWSLRKNESLPISISQNLKDYKYLEVGFFHETLPKWIERQGLSGISFIHYDAGDYEATCFVLENLGPLLQKGSIIVFDEFIPSPTELIASEYEAFVLHCKVDYEIITRSGSSVGIRII